MNEVGIQSAESVKTVPIRTADSPDSPPEERPWTQEDEELFDEWRWVHEQRQTDLFAPYAGEHVAVYKRQIIESSRDPRLLRRYAAEKLHVHPERIVIVFID